MTATGLAVGHESAFIDLRGKLPVRQDIQYKMRTEAEIDGIIWHHTASRAQTIRSIAEYHTKVRGWPEIAYHFAVGHDGKVYQLLDVQKWSHHAAGHNRNNIGIVLIGNYEDNEPSPQMLASAKIIQRNLVQQYNIKHVWLHKDTKATLCPGKHATKTLRKWQFGELPKKK